MGIIIKYTLRNIKEHKGRTFLIMLSILLSVGMFFASFTISKTITNMVMENFKAFFGTAEIMVYPGRFNDSGLIKMKDLGDYKKDYAYMIGAVEWNVKYKDSSKKKVDINLKGYDLKELDIMNPIEILESENLDDFKGKKVIVGSDFAKKNGFKLGDHVKLIFDEDDMKFFKIAGIADDKGVFKISSFSSGDSVNMITPKKTLGQFIGARGRVNTIYAKSVDEQQIEKNIEQLKEIYAREYVDKTVTKGEIDAEVRPIRIPLMFMLVLVVLISMFIIYTSFKVIVLERLPMIGTFRSIGATKKMTDFIMLLESTLYGIIGSLSGCALGILILKGAVVLMEMGKGGSGKVDLAYSIGDIGIACSFGLTLAFVSSLIPIIKVSKTSIKEILLNIIDGTKKKKTYIRYIFGSIFAIFAFVIPNLKLKGTVANVVNGASIVFIIFTIVAFVPLITNILVHLLEGLFGILFGNIGILSIKNLKSNKNTYNNIILLTIGLASVITISSMSKAIEEGTVKEIVSQKYDILVRASEGSKLTIQRIKSIEGIKDVYMYQKVFSVYKYNKSQKPMFNQVLGISNERLLDHFDYDILGTDQDEEIIASILKGRKLIVANKIKEKYNFKLGQNITLETEIGDRDYEIVGFINTKESGGLFAITSSKNIQHDLKQKWGLSIAVKVKKHVDISHVKEKIEGKIKSLNWSWVETKEEKKQRAIDMNRKLVMIMWSFAAATVVIGSIGVMNNFLVGFLMRRKSLAVYSSVGMGKRQMMKMIIIESATSGVLGAIFGSITSILMILSINEMLRKIEIPLEIKINMSMILMSILGAVVVCMIASIGVLRKSSKLSVLEELRFE